MQKKCLLPITNPVNTRKSGKQFLREGSSPPSEWKESFRMIRVRGSKTIASRYCRLECTKKLGERIRSNRRKTGWWNCLIHARGAHSCDSWTKDGKLYSSAFFSIREPRPIRITEHESDGVVWGKSKSKLWRERGRERERERERIRYSGTNVHSTRRRFIRKSVESGTFHPLWGASIPNPSSRPSMPVFRVLAPSFPSALVFLHK